MHDEEIDTAGVSGFAMVIEAGAVGEQRVAPDIASGAQLRCYEGFDGAS